MACSATKHRLDSSHHLPKELPTDKAGPLSAIRWHQDLKLLTS